MYRSPLGAECAFDGGSRIPKSVAHADMGVNGMECCLRALPPQLDNSHSELKNVTPSVLIYVYIYMYILSYLCIYIYIHTYM